MKNETEEDFGSSLKLTRPLLQKLKDRGFRYVQVMGFTSDRRLDYMEPRFLLLVPIMELSDDPAKQEIYEPINSKILEDWANSPDEGIEILISLNKV
ncbi:MAG: hypothetical protein JST75_21145 [Bacteroidetes bacterium]|nr:hypothetical protein [Bacteroidota bacterium]